MRLSNIVMSAWLGVIGFVLLLAFPPLGLAVCAVALFLAFRR
jgi:hypothetical protein